MFDKDYKITGKHANYWKDLCELFSELMLTPTSHVLSLDSYITGKGELIILSRATLVCSQRR